MSKDIIYLTLIVIFFITGSLLGAYLEKTHHSKETYSMPCAPTDCQNRLGEHSIIIYSLGNNLSQNNLPPFLFTEGGHYNIQIIDKLF